MSDYKFDDGIEMVRLGDEDTYYDGKLTPEEIELKKRASHLMSAAREKAKLQHCYLCEKECSSFCNSHSVPQFALYGIADNGMTSTSIQGKMLFQEKNTGVSQAGTFHIICDNCDNTRFQEYETPDAYLKEPTNKMLAQMALKNYLLLIDKKSVNFEVYTLMKKEIPESYAIAEEKAFNEKFDLERYIIKFKYAQKATQDSGKKYYHLCYYQILDYVVPYTSQCAITLIAGFNDELINNVYNFSKEYDMKEIHIAVFPLKTTSVVMLFIEEGEKRYRKFYKHLKKLPLEDQLATINYIIFSNTEDVYINPKTQKSLRDDKNFDDVCRLTTDTLSRYNCSTKEQIAKAIKEFSLSKRHKIPNLLSREHAISSDTKDE